MQDRIRETYTAQNKTFVVREAHLFDAPAILSLFDATYQGKYPLEFGNNLDLLKGEIADIDHYLWICAHEENQNELVGAMMFSVDLNNRMAKAGGAVVEAQHRKFGLGSTMLKRAVHYLTEVGKQVDVLYATSRCVNEGPSRIVAEAGFKKLGFFPNAVLIEEMEHLNLDVYLTDRAMAARRTKPYLFSPFYEVYKIARKQLGLERAYLITEREPLKLSGKKIKFHLNSDEKEVISKFRLYSDQKRISNSFFPFHSPNFCLSSEDGGSDVFVWYGGMGKQASILGFRTDQVNLHDLLDSAAMALQKAGAAYVELLVDAYDYMAQQEAYTAKYIPSGYFPAMRLGEDGFRDDYFVVSRTFQILDFASACVMTENLPYLEAYMRFYNELYIDSIRRSPLRKKK